jgi:hypothetical protein
MVDVTRSRLQLVWHDHQLRAFDNIVRARASIMLALAHMYSYI